MPFGGAPHNREPRLRAREARPPAWAAAGLTAVLLASGLGRRRYQEAGRRRLSARGEVPPQATARHERSRGRLAKRPSEIPLKGWKDILVGVYRNVSTDRIVEIAAGVTFYAILAIFPGLAAFVSVYGLIADPNTISSVLNSLSGVLPAGVIDVIGDEMQHLMSQPRSTLGTTFLVSFRLSLCTATPVIQSIFAALNIVYHEKEKRGFLKLNAVSLAFTLAAMLSGVVVLLLVAVLPCALDRLETV